MASISYEEIFSRFFTKVEAYDLMDEEDDYVAELMCNWLRSAVYYPYVRKLFSSITMDDEEQTITYELKRSIDEGADKFFLIDLLSYGVAYAWVQPKVNSITNIVQNMGTSDAKFYSQAAHLSELRGLRDDSERKIRELVRDRGYLYNDYLDGKAASATIRRTLDV